MSVVADNALSVSQAEKLTGMPQQRVYLRRRTAASFLTAPHAASRRPGAPTGRRVEARQAKVLTADEARRIDINIARLPELLGKGERD